MTTVHFVVPEGIDDLNRPSGGNVYDRRLSRGLAELGWHVLEQPVSGTWPGASDSAHAALTAVMSHIPDGSVVIVDGLIGSAAPGVLVHEGRRLRLVVLVHMPLGLTSGNDGGSAAAGERAVLCVAEAVVTTSPWTRAWLLERYCLSPDAIRVAEPGADAADIATGTPGGSSLICVAAVSPLKGHDVLIAALSSLTDRSWTCHLVGSLTVDPSFTARLRDTASAKGIEDRLRFAGPLSGGDLDAAYAGADALVLASRAETYGMVITEALARGLPVVATSVGGVPYALGRASDGTPPGLLLRAGDPSALADALRRWLDQADLRVRLRSAARDRRLSLGGWSTTVARVSRLLAEVTS